ncbi:MAG: hypothetical protein GY811_24970 [Myxococcales bacterium]|nr:hypothetical protein [Myxococcales bacterium]
METLEGLGTKAQIRNTGLFYLASQIEIKPKGLQGDHIIDQREEEDPIVSLLLTKNEIWLGIAPVGERLQIRNVGEAYDWASLEDALADYREVPALAASPRRNEIEIAAEDDVVYQDVITAMDYSIGRDFVSIGYLDPPSLSVRFKE